MRRALAIGVLLLAAAPAPASGEITAGPVIADDGAAWADRPEGGAVRVLTLRPGGRAVVARRWARPRDGASDRRITAVAAGEGRGRAVVRTCTGHRRSLIDSCAARTFAGPFARLRGPRLPERVGERCPRSPRSAEEVAMSGGWTAVLSDACLGRYAGTAAFRRRIEARRGALRRTIPLRLGHGLRLAGRYLAWQDGHGGAVLYDLRRGERVRRLGSARGGVGRVDVQTDGTLALVRGGARNRTCVSTLPLGGAERRLDCWFEPPLGIGAQAGGSGGSGPPAAVAVAGGRVLYLREQQELVLRRPGGAPEVIARFAPELKRVGDIDLGPHGATWAEQPHRVPDADGMPGMPVPAGPQRVVIRPL